jgi:lipase
MGAITALALAAEYPELVSAILLEDPPLRTDATPPPAAFIDGLRQEFASYKDMSPGQRTARSARQNAGWHFLEVEPWGQSKAEVDPAVLQQVGRFDGYSWVQAFRRIQCPGLLIIGDASRQAIVTEGVARQAMALWPNGEVLHISGAGHCIHRDQYEATLRAINTFLQRQGHL